MKDSQGQSDACPTLKSLSNKLGGMLFCHNTQDKYKRLDNKLEKKITEMKKSASKISHFRSINGIIMRFPQIKEGLKDIQSVFEQYDEDSNGTIDHKELKKCLRQLQLHITEREIDDLFHSCDVDRSGGIQFREFIVVLCLIYLLFDHSNSPHTMGSTHVRSTFDTIIEAFLFLDKNGDGKLNKEEIIKALNEECPGEKSPIHISRTRFEEMDWDRDGKVSYREFLFSLINWVGIDCDDENGRQVHGLVYRYGFHTNVYVGSSLVDMYARCGLMNEAKFAFDGLMSKNEVSWNALIAGHVREGEGEKAIGLFVEMQRENFRPTLFTYSTIFGGSANNGALEQGKWVHTHMIKSGGKLVSFVGNTLLDMYGKSGSIKDAKKIFNRLIKQDLVSWNTMLTACAQHGLGNETVEKFEEMLINGIKPNAVTFLCVLTACSHAGLLDRGKYYFDLMKKYKVEQEVSHYVTVVDLFGRAGQLDWAKEFIESMPIEPSAAVWGALLGACRMHKNIEMGAYAAKHVFELDPDDSGPRVILYNMYAYASRWDDAARVRKMMRESGVKKEPACSWVEIENMVHMFVANDDSHPMRKEIFKKWEEISTKIKEIGYVPDASLSLSFADQEEREAKLQYHSEKLALAFALIRAPLGSTLRVKKNIRVCGDCHSVFKFVSKVEEREIVLRDKNRFHHFSNGVCSCGDYW